MNNKNSQLNNENLQMNTKNFLELLINLYAEQEKIKVRFFVAKDVSKRNHPNNKLFVRKPSA